MCAPSKKWLPDWLCHFSLFQVLFPIPYPAGLKSLNSTWCNILEDGYAYTHHCENLKFHLVLLWCPQYHEAATCILDIQYLLLMCFLLQIFWCSHIFRYMRNELSFVLVTFSHFYLYTCIIMMIIFFLITKWQCFDIWRIILTIILGFRNIFETIKAIFIPYHSFCWFTTILACCDGCIEASMGTKRLCLFHTYLWLWLHRAFHVYLL